MANLTNMVNFANKVNLANVANSPKSPATNKSMQMTRQEGPFASGKHGEFYEINVTKFAKFAHKQECSLWKRKLANFPPLSYIFIY